MRRGAGGIEKERKQEMELEGVRGRMVKKDICTKRDIETNIEREKER